jgi:hypothetical protein
MKNEKENKMDNTLLYDLLSILNPDQRSLLAYLQTEDDLTEDDMNANFQLAVLFVPILDTLLAADLIGIHSHCDDSWGGHPAKVVEILGVADARIDIHMMQAPEAEQGSGGGGGKALPDEKQFSANIAKQLDYHRNGVQPILN